MKILRRLWRKADTEDLMATSPDSQVGAADLKSTPPKDAVTRDQDQETAPTDEPVATERQFNLAYELINVKDLGTASLTLAKAVDAVLEKDRASESAELSEEDRTELNSLMAQLLGLAQQEVKSEDDDSELKALTERYQHLAGINLGNSDSPQSADSPKSRREMLTGVGGALLGGGALAAMMTPQRAHALFGMDGSMMVAAITTFANQLFKALNSGISDINGMFGDLGEGIGALDEQLNFNLGKVIEQGSDNTDKQITALGALGDRLSEQLVANAQVSAAVGSQPGSGVCGDETIGAASANLSNLVRAQTVENDATARVSKVNAARALSSSAATNERKERVGRIRPPNGAGEWRTDPLSYSRTIAPGATSKREAAQSEAGADYIKWVSEPIPNGTGYFPEPVYFNAETDRMVTMILQKEARTSVADHALNTHYNEGLGDRTTYNGMRAYFGENVRVQEAGLQKARQSQMQAQNGDGDTSASDNAVAVNTAALELSKNLLNMLDDFSTGSGSSRAISQRGLEDFTIRRWTGPEYKAFLRSSGPEPAPLLRDLISLNGDALKMEKERLDEQRLTNDLLQTMLRELIDSNTIREREMKAASQNDRV